jgi:hypothetical protein
MDGNKYTIEEIIRLNGKYVGPTMGVSMLPMLKEGRDTIVVSAKTKRLKRLDVALYKRDGKYILHRVLQPIDGGYIIRGDNCYEDENIPEDAVFGVLTEFFQKDKHTFVDDKKYLKYVKKRLKSYPIRKFFHTINRKCRSAIKKILRIKR